MQQQIENEQQQYEETAKHVYENLRAIDASKYIEKKNGLSYVSWANALHLALTEYPLLKWEVREWGGLPYCKTECGFFVEVSVTIEGIKRSCKLPVIDYSNKTISQPNAFQINTSHQRALTKCLGLHGMALYVYAGEDLPFSYGEETQQPVEIQTQQDLSEYQPIADAIIEKINAEDFVAVGEIWSGLDKSEMESLWVAKTKGGFFSTSEKSDIRKGINAYKDANTTAEDLINE